MKVERLNTAIPKNNKWHEEDIRTKAAELDVKPSELVLKALDAALGFDNDFIKRITAYADALNVPLHIAIQNIIIDRWAREEAEDAVEPLPRIHLEYLTVTDDKGTRMLTGEELRKHLFDLYYQEAKKDRETFLKRRKR